MPPEPSADVLEKLTIRPRPASTRKGCTALDIRNDPRRCTDTTASQSSSLSSGRRLSRVMPALLIRTVGGPSTSTSSATERATSSARPTSAPERNRATTRRRDRINGLRRRRLHPIQDANGPAARRAATAASMPLAAPVTAATRTTKASLTKHHLTSALTDESRQAQTSLGELHLGSPSPSGMVMLILSLGPDLGCATVPHRLGDTQQGER